LSVSRRLGSDNELLPIPCISRPEPGIASYLRTRLSHPRTLLSFPLSIALQTSRIHSTAPTPTPQSRRMLKRSPAPKPQSALTISGRPPFFQPALSFHQPHSRRLLTLLPSKTPTA